MKKQLLVGAIMLASVLSANAQTILSQDFEGAVTGWGVYDADGDTEVFGIFNSGAAITELGFTGKVAGSTNFIINDDDTFTPLDDTDNMLNSPVIELPAGSSYMSFRIGSFAITEEGGAAHYSAYVMTAADLADVTDAAGFIAAVQAKTPIVTGDVEDTSEVKTADLTSIGGGEVVFVIRQHDQAGSYAYLFIDDITFTEGVMGVNENLASQLSVFPNPTSDVVNVANADNILVNGITVTDLNGRTVKTTKFDGVANAQINVSDLASGVYMMTVSSDKGSMTKKIVKN